MRAGKIPALVHEANVAGLETQTRETASPAPRRVDNRMTPADFVRHWKAAEASGNEAKIKMLTDLMSGLGWDYYDAVENEFAKN